MGRAKKKSHKMRVSNTTDFQALGRYHLRRTIKRPSFDNEKVLCRRKEGEEKGGEEKATKKTKKNHSSSDGFETVADDEIEEAAQEDGNGPI